MDKEENNLSKNSRLFEIIKILTAHNALFNLARQTNPEEVREAFEELGPTFIKLGQLLSTRDDIISEEYVNEFKKLQDQVRTDDFEIVREIIETSTNMKINELFEELDETPLASASIGQVHFGKLLSGTEVVIKIQHPFVYEKMSTDIELLEKAIPLMRFIPNSNMINPYDMIDELKRSLLIELDFNNEADNIEKFFEYNIDENIICPKVYRQFSNKNLLIMDYMKGTKISNYITDADEKISKGNKEFINIKKNLAYTLVNNYIKQIFEDGFFHADPHPGNILICVDKLVYLDFGMMGNLDDQTIEKLNRIVAALVKQDEALIAKAITNLCKHSKDLNMDILTDDVGKLFSRYYDMSIGDMNLPEIVNNVIMVCSKNHLILPSNVALLFKGITTMEGLILQLDPNLSFMSAIEPYARNYLIKQFDFQKESLQLLRILTKFIKIAPELPVKLSKVLDDTINGKLKLNTDMQLYYINRIFGNLSLSIITAALIIGSSYIIQNDKLINLGTSGFIIAFVLIIFLLFNIYKKK